MAAARHRPISRRHFLGGSAAGLAAGAVGPDLIGRSPEAAQRGRGSIDPATLGDGPILVKGGCVLSGDPTIGDFDTADVLIDGSTIAAVGPDLDASATVIDATGTIVMPGFVDTHRHMWQGVIRNSLPNGLLGDYVTDVLGTIRPVFRPEDVRVGDLVSALGALNAGITTLLDWSHIGNSPEHTDAAIEGLRQAGVRAVYAYGSGVDGPQNAFPEDIRRLRRERFSSEDQLLTLAMATGGSADEWAVARDVGAPITLHLGSTDQLRAVADIMGPDVTYIHCNGLTDEGWRMIADSGGHVSISCPIEMEMGHGVPAIQEALDHGIKPSLSVDVETEMPGDLFNQMRAVFTLQRMLLLGRQRAGEDDLPPLLTVRDVVEFATIQGARDNQLDSRIGSLTPGKEADLIMLRMDAINVMPVNDAHGAVVLGMDTSNVDTVFVGGRVRKWQGELVGVDLERLRADAERSRDFVTSRAGWPQTLVGRSTAGGRQ